MRLITKLRRAPSRSSALVVPVGASAPSITGRVMGGFTLPVPVEWSQCILPAGQYVFVVSSAPSPSWVYVRRNEELSVFYAAASVPAADARRSQIGLLYDGSHYHVRSLTLRETGTTLLFGVRMPETAEQEEKRRHGVLYVLLRPFVEDLEKPNQSLSTSDHWRHR